MQRIVLAIAVFAITQLVTSGGVRAAEGPWCAVLNFGSDVSEDCQYRSFEECRPAVLAGFRGFCNLNPRWQGAPMEPRAYRKRAAQRQY